MTVRPQVPREIVARLRSVCLSLPEAYEETAWVGVRWRVRKETFAHVLMVESGWPPAYAQAAGSDGPIVVMTFRSSIAEIDPRHYAEHPFFRPRWWPDIVGMVIEPGVDWQEVAGLLTGSYCLLAPKKLAGLVNPPSG